ncbi:cytochrome p450 monooxygenase [Paramyrothecium foliicola]|nr:cytochrome p450 monooxygenase [Paramyrothecium foliicola]
MSLNNSSWSALEAGNTGLSPICSNLIIYTITVGLLLASVFFWLEQSKTPVANAPAWWQPSLKKQIEWLKEGLHIMTEARNTSDGKPFKVLTEFGPITVLPPRFADAIRNMPALGFREVISADQFPNLPGFETFKFAQDKANIATNVVKKHLTKHLSHKDVVTAPLASEATFATKVVFGDSVDWNEICVRDNVLDYIARLSSRVFLGEVLCRNDDWLKMTKEYTITSFKASMKLRMTPYLMRPYVFLFDKDLIQTRTSLKEARKIVQVIIKGRNEAKKQAQRDGRAPLRFDDAIEWAEAECKGVPYDAAVFQLALSMAAIHTTTDLLTQTLICLASQPELIEPLRQEMVAVLQVDGWKKSALYNLKLLDSAVKEAQRIKPMSMLAMRRLALKNVELPEGFHIKKGEKIVVDGYNMVNPEIHDNPDKYDIYRFRKLREQPGCENRAQLVTTTADHLVFGHGAHACPGRFFAANEVKLALCFLLMKYDWKVAEGSPVVPSVTGANQMANPSTRLLLRRRKEEINLEALSC